MRREFNKYQQNVRVSPLWAPVLSFYTASGAFAAELCETSDGFDRSVKFLAMANIFSFGITLRIERI
jgi:hypothetical protein